MFGGNKPFAFGTPTTSAGSVFGTSTFSSTTPTTGGLFGAAQPQQATTTSLFGQTSSSTTAPSFGTAFGTQPSGTMFGQPAANNNTGAAGTLFGSTNQPVFGASTQPAFGAATGQQQPAFGAAQNQQQSAFGAKPLAFGAANKSIFGGTQSTFGSTPQPAFGASTQPSAFGTSNPPAFGTPQSGTLFGSSTTTANPGSAMFGASATTATQGANGSAIIRFQPPMSTDTVMKNNQQQQVNVRHQHISAMREYENKSADEIRIEDYLANRKGPQAGAAPAAAGTGMFGTSTASQPTGLFGASTTQTASTGLFGASQPAAAATGNSLFGKPATSIFGTTQATGSTGLFGTSTQPAAASTSLFGQQTTPAQQSTSLFGQPAAQTQQNTSLFGQPAAQTQQNTSLFGQQPAQTQQNTLFGQNKPAQPTTSLFGNTQPAAGSLFGSNPAQPNTSLFGNTGNTAQPTTSLFGQPAAQSQPAASLFGSTAQQPAQQNATPFGGTNLFNTANAAKPLFGSTAPQPGTAGGLFGTTQTQPAAGTLFGTQQPAASTSGSLFGTAQPQTAAAGSLFGTAQPQQQPAGAGQPFGTSFANTATQPGFGSLFNKPANGTFGTQLLSTPQTTTTTNSLFAKPLNAFGTTAQQPAAGGSLFGTSTQPAATGFSFSGATQQPAGSSLFGTTGTTQSAAAGTLFGTAQPQTSFFGAPSSTLFAGNQTQPGSVFTGQQAAAQPAADALVSQLQMQNSLLQQMVVALSAQAPYGNNPVLSNLVERSRTGEPPPQRAAADPKSAPLSSGSPSNDREKATALLQSLIQDDRRTLLTRPTSFLAQRSTLNSLFNRPVPAASAGYGGLLRSVSAQLNASGSKNLFPEPSFTRSFAERHESIGSRSFAGRAGGGWLDELDAASAGSATRFATRRQLKQLVIRPPAPSLYAASWNLRSPMPSSQTPFRRSEESESDEDDEYRAHRTDRVRVIRRRSDGEQLRRAEDRRSGPPDLEIPAAAVGPSPFRTPERPVAKSSAVPKRLTFDSPEADSAPASASVSILAPAGDADRSNRSDTVIPKRDSEEKLSPASPRRADEDGTVSSSQLHPARIVLTRSGYYTKPSLAELARHTDENGDCFVNEFVVGRVGYGEVHFGHREAVVQAKVQAKLANDPAAAANTSMRGHDSRPASPSGQRPGWFNVAGINLDEIIVIERKAVTVYPNDDDKPTIGDGLNRPARITLLGIYPRDKVSREPIRDPSRIERLRYADRIAAATREIGAHFVRYTPADGAWTFDVTHFSKYGLAGDDEDEETGVSVPPVKAASVPAASSKQPDVHSQPNVDSDRERKVDKQVLLLDGSTVAVRDGDETKKPASASVLNTNPNLTMSASSHRTLANSSIAGSGNQASFISQLRRTPALTGPRSFLDLDAVDDRRAQATRVADLERDAMLLLSELEQTPQRLATTRSFAEDTKLASVLLAKTPTATTVATVDKSDKKLLNLEQLEAAASLMTGSRYDSVVRLFAPVAGASGTLVDGLTRVRCWNVALRANGPAGDRLLPVARRFRARFGPQWSVILPARADQLSVTAASRKRPFANGLALSRLSASPVEESPQFVAQTEALLNVALGTCAFERDEHCGVPFARPNASALDEMLAAYVRLMETEDGAGEPKLLTKRLFDPDAVCEVRSALRLFAALFGSVPSELQAYNRNFGSARDGALKGNQTAAAQTEYTLNQTRKELVTRWLETELRQRLAGRNNNNQDSAKSNSHLTAVFERLVEHRIEEAATLCADAGDLRLALLVSQIGRNGAAPRRVRELIDEQLNIWTSELPGCTRFIDSNRLKLYHLLAGRMTSVGYSPSSLSDTKPKMNQSMNATMSANTSVSVNVCDKLDWFEAFGMHLWYANVPSASLEHVLRTFDRAWKPLLGARATAYCEPPNKRIHNGVSKERVVKSVCYHLIKLYSKRSHRLEKLLMPESMVSGTDSTPQFATLCDGRFGWLFWQLLQSAGLTHLPLEAQVRLHMAYAAQLESTGMWDWAVFVLLHVPHSASRQSAIRALLLRNATISRVEMEMEIDQSADLDESSEDVKGKQTFSPEELEAFEAQRERENFLCERLGVSRDWLNEAKAARARCERLFELAAFYALQHADYAAAHRTLLDDILPDLVLADDYARIDTLLNYFERVFVTSTARRGAHEGESNSLPEEYALVLPDWYVNGARVYRDLVQLVQSSASTVDQLRTAARDGDFAELVRFVNELQQRVVSLCVRLRSFRTINKQQKMAKIEFVRVLNNLLNSVRRRLLPSVPPSERGFASLPMDSDDVPRIDSSLLEFSAAKCELLELSGPLSIVELDC